ncbi:MAG: pro-sigmaK processing inhibitor BofA family protein [Bacilli bacterium]|nr:pro-sigmaK processing inhibitor BofA family protein [Bacilli bacterium]
MKKISSIIKKVIFAIVLLYSYNLVAVSFNMVIPINFFTISFLTFLDAPGLVLLGLILKLFYWG